MISSYSMGVNRTFSSPSFIVSNGWKAGQQVFTQGVQSTTRRRTVVPR